MIFWGFISVLFVALYKASPQWRFIISWIGLVFFILWTRVNKGSKAWQQSWEIKTEYYIREIYKYDNLYKKTHEEKEEKCEEKFGESKKDKKSLIKDVFDKFENICKKFDSTIWFFTESDYSMSKLLIALSNFYIFIWIGAIIYYSDWQFILNFDNTILSYLFVVFCNVYILFSHFACRSNRKNNANKEFEIIDS